MNIESTVSCQVGREANQASGRRRFLPQLSVLVLLAACGEARAASLAAEGCPTFHCTVEATGVIAQPVIPAVSTIISNGSLGGLQKQGCSGDGTLLACLFSTDTATGTAQGTLKVLDATTLQPMWGSAGVAGSYNLDARTASNGQVPVIFADGTIGAGDLHYYVHYSAAGVALNTVSLRGSTADFGLTPISPTYGIVSQMSGVLTLVNLTTWTNAGTLLLVDPETNGSLQLVSPSSGAGNVLYAVAQNKITGTGYLFSVVLNTATNKMAVSNVFSFTGQTGASGVAVLPSISGLANNLILLHVPGLIGDVVPQNRLLGLLDSPTGWQQLWAIPLTAPLVVAPTVDQGSVSLFYHQNNSPIIYQSQLLTGAAIKSFNLQKISGIPNTFQLNTHLGASQVGSVFTLLLGGESTSAPGVGAQYVMAFQPLVSPQTLLWSEQIASAPASYMAAWNSAPSSESGIECLIAIPVTTSGSTPIVRLCDF